MRQWPGNTAITVNVIAQLSYCESHDHRKGDRNFNEDSSYAYCHFSSPASVAKIYFCFATVDTILNRLIPNNYEDHLAQ
jgi:hypothetical protein